QQEEHARRAGHVRDLGQQPLALRIDPVRIVEMDQYRPGAAEGPEQTAEEAGNQTLVLDGVGNRRRPGWIAHTEEVVREWYRLLERAVESDQAFRNRLARQSRIRGLIHVEGAAQQIPQHAEGGRSCM